MYAALGATNEAILYAKSSEELHRWVCDAAFSSGDFRATAIFLLQPGTQTLRFTAGAGELVPQLRKIEISIAETTSRSLGLAGEAFRDQTPLISNDFLDDDRSWAYRNRPAKCASVQSGAATHLRRRRSISGAL
jgi:hypothetical protein